MLIFPVVFTSSPSMADSREDFPEPTVPLNTKIYQIQDAAFAITIIFGKNMNLTNYGHQLSLFNT